MGVKEYCEIVGGPPMFAKIGSSLGRAASRRPSIGGRRPRRLAGPGAWRVGLLAAALGLAAQAPAAERVVAGNVLDLAASGRVAVDLAADGAYRLNVQVRNLSPSPVLVRFPAGLVADSLSSHEALAQIRQPGTSGSGIQFPGAQSLGLLSEGEMAVASNQTVRHRFTTACLNYGLPEPNPQTPLFLKSVEEYSPDPGLQTALVNLAKSDIDISSAQMVLWHVANGLDWRQLSRMNPRGVPPNPMRIARAQSFLANPQEAAPVAAREDVADATEPDRPAPRLSLSLNPDPRGSRAADPLVRRVAQSVRELQPAIRVGHENQPRGPVDQSVGQVHWSVLLRTRSGAADRPVVATVWTSRWDPATARWNRQEPFSVIIPPDRSQSEAGAGQQFAEQLLEALTAREFEVAWSGGKTGALAIESRLPVPVRSLAVSDSRRPGAGAWLESISLPAGPARIELALTAEQSDRLAGAKKLVASRFEIADAGPRAASAP